MFMCYKQNLAKKNSEIYNTECHTYTKKKWQEMFDQIVRARIERRFHCSL